MADHDPASGAADGVANAPPSSIGLDAQAQFRTLSQRLDRLAEEMRQFEKPNKFRLADAIQLGAIVLTLIVAIFTAFGLNNRIDDLVKGQTASEARITTRLGDSEKRLDAQIDRMDDRLIKVGERAAALEGGRRR